MKQTLHGNFIQNPLYNSILVHVPDLVDPAFIEIMQSEVISSPGSMQKVKSIVCLFCANLLAAKSGVLAQSADLMCVARYLKSGKNVVTSIQNLVEEVRLFHDLENSVPE